MNEETTFLDTLQPQTNVLADVQKQAAKLSELYAKFAKAEMEYKIAEKEYNDYRCTYLPNLFRMNGLSALTLTDGTQVKVETKYHCSPNKNAGDKAALADWLRKVGGTQLVKQEARVIQQDIVKLQEAKIPFEELTEVNTNSLKAWLKGQIGADGSPATMELGEIPKYVHFVAVDECTIE